MEKPLQSIIGISKLQANLQDLNLQLHLGIDYSKMIIKCTNTGADYMPEKIFKFYRKNEDIDFQAITTGKEYIVYAISIHFDHPFYMICGDDYDGKYVNYPHLLPGCLFEIVDMKTPKE